MKNQHADEMDKLITRLKEGREKIIKGSAAKALAFFKKSFRDQGFTDNKLVKWKPRSGGPKNSGRAIGIDKGSMKRGLRIMQANKRGARLSVDPAIKYAEIQNEGGEIPITTKMRRFFWAMYFKSGGTKGMAYDDMPELAKFYRNLALTKEDKIIIPKRQFIGDSAVLEKELVKYIEVELMKIFDKK